MTISDSTRGVLLVLIVAAGVVAVGVLAACDGEPVPYEMGQPIEMGPFVFAVEGTTETFWRDDKEIDVRFGLDRKRSKAFRKAFDEAFMTRLEIVDEAGNRFEPRSFGAIDGNRLSAREWEARFVLFPNAPGMRDRESIGDTPSDFRLVITNPDRRSSQPRRVEIALE